MYKHLIFVLSLLFVNCPNAISQDTSTFSATTERQYFVESLVRICDPVLTNLAKDQLKANMPIEKADKPYDHREEVVHLEAIGRTYAGIAPWLKLGPDNTEEGHRYV